MVYAGCTGDRTAADIGLSYAQQMVGPPDLESALMWFRIAEELGSESAKANAKEIAGAAAGNLTSNVERRIFVCLASGLRACMPPI
jgi:hypothetical protein